MPPAATSFYDGGRFARDGVVCVTIGYRVGAEGFLFLNDGIANRRSPRPDRGPAMGSAEHRNLRGRRLERHHLRRVGRRHERRDPTVRCRAPAACSDAPSCRAATRPSSTSAATAERIGRRRRKLMGVDATRSAIARTACRAHSSSTSEDCGRACSSDRTRRSGARSRSATFRGHPP